MVLFFYLGQMVKMKDEEGFYQIVNKGLYNTNRDRNGYTWLNNNKYDKLCIFGTVSDSPFFLMTNSNNNKYLSSSDNFIRD